MSIGLKDLRAFLAVIDERSFARAAERLNVAQPALSRRIAKMEETLGFPLFTRTTRRVVPTAAGRVFADKALLVLAEMDRAVDAAGRAAQGRTGEVMIGYNDFAIGGPLPDVIQDFKDGNGDIWLRLHRAGTEEQLAMLRRKQLDVCFLIGPIFADGLNRHTVWRDRYCAVMSENDPLVTAPAISLADLARRPFVLGDRKGWQAYRERLRRLFAKVDHFPEITAEGPDTSVVLGLVASGIGVTIYPACIENIFRRGVAFRPIADTEATVETVMVWDPETTNPAALRFVEGAMRYCSRWPDGHYDSKGIPENVARLDLRR